MQVRFLSREQTFKNNNINNLTIFNLCLAVLNLVFGYINYKNENYKLSIYNFCAATFTITSEMLILYYDRN